MKCLHLANITWFILNDSYILRLIYKGKEMKFPNRKVFIEHEFSKQLYVIIEQKRNIWRKMVGSVRKGLCYVK